ncbi:hypothetical protein SYNTR_1435 [Candidatus Syntrophocurvum alkaliphilum]|uniref:Zinc/iron-chelating domain-containing protein n=1 Tax=Candidatus Syntrophocurvum alkaliphilum TaxID=2293317 RepID=A0A6I6DBB0_9FIRM|nr:hypothetical protein [Candidatus Syntrophocurvum alkaliphilum]QGU00029.1 hypothetical protein SYNTR_1435 [Candidatus Syntrophocurvum alkaliphilum]
MEKEINLIFYNKGLRSYIEVDLCSECPRQDYKGCCGFYSPVFYPTDFAFLLENQPDIIDSIFSFEDITILDSSVTVNNKKDGDSYLCRFHTKEKGCILPQHLRESICRHFVCPGIDWQNNEKLQDWKEFFDKLSDYEIDLNNNIANILKQKGLSLRNPNTREEFFNELQKTYKEEIKSPPKFLTSFPESYHAKLNIKIKYKEEWPL